MIKVDDIKKDFPIFERKINGNKLTYLDSGATSQKPNQVIDVMSDVYKNNNANVHRGTYVLSSETTSKYEEVRVKFKKFINAYNSDEIIFTKGCTEGFNLLANSLCKNLNKDDEIILSEIEHHANIIPWQMAAKKYDVSAEEVKKCVAEMEQNEAKMDPVDKKELKKKFDDREDGDIDNDGDEDESDKYLQMRRKAISKALKTKNKEK